MIPNFDPYQRSFIEVFRRFSTKAYIFNQKFDSIRSVVLRDTRKNQSYWLKMSWREFWRVSWTVSWRQSCKYSWLQSWRKSWIRFDAWPLPRLFPSLPSRVNFSALVSEIFVCKKISKGSEAVMTVKLEAFARPRRVMSCPRKTRLRWIRHTGLNAVWINLQISSRKR